MTNLRLNPTKITNLASQSENPIYIFNRGKPISVLLDIKSYESLIDQLEDALDVAEIKKNEKKMKNQKWIAHEDIIKELNFE